MYYVVVGIEILMILFFSIAGAMKLTSHPHMVDEFNKFQYPLWLMRLTALIEMGAVILLVAGFKISAFAALGAWLLVPVMIGAAYTNFTKRPAAFGWGTVVIVVLCLIPALYFTSDLIAVI